MLWHIVKQFDVHILCIIEQLMYSFEFYLEVFKINCVKMETADGHLLDMRWLTVPSWCLFLIYISESINNDVMSIIYTELNFMKYPYMASLFSLISKIFSH